MSRGFGCEQFARRLLRTDSSFIASDSTACVGKYLGVLSIFIDVVYFANSFLQNLVNRRKAKSNKVNK